MYHRLAVIAGHRDRDTVISFSLTIPPRTCRCDSYYSHVAHRAAVSHATVPPLPVPVSIFRNGSHAYLPTSKILMDVMLYG